MAKQGRGDAWLVFTLARERFALPSRHVLAVARLRAMTPLPGAAPPVVGLTGWRGLVLTLADLRGITGAATGGLDDLGHVIVLGDARPIVGLLADAVLETTRVADADVRPLPAGRGADVRVLRGVTRDALLVLDVPALLALLDDAPASPAPAAP